MKVAGRSRRRIRRRKCDEFAHEDDVVIPVAIVDGLSTTAFLFETKALIEPQRVLIFREYIKLKPPRTALPRECLCSRNEPRTDAFAAFGFEHRHGEICILTQLAEFGEQKSDKADELALSFGNKGMHALAVDEYAQQHVCDAFLTFAARGGKMRSLAFNLGTQACEGPDLAEAESSYRDVVVFRLLWHAKQSGCARAVLDIQYSKSFK